MLSDEGFKESVEFVAKVLDLFGVAAIVIGILIATVMFVAHLGESSGGRRAAYRRFRQGIGRAILLGLELFVAADIIRTVAVAPTFRGIGVLAGIVLVRTFLSFTLEVELEGRWPWQRPPRGAPAG